ncbi:MAG TPA: sugar phosphate nucleotidyltransferase [Bryobacteraceae bacterium]|nr:sugar phosphate nucleotidyltransferase [Bryobacteraceae bacterium]
MQCVILAGGLGTRMRPLTVTCPKTLLPVRNRPFAWHQVHWLASQGVDDLIYCIGHQGDLIRRYWESQPKPLPSIRYVDEGEQLRGTGGALRLAHKQSVLDESFLVIYGDSFLPVEFPPIWRAFQASEMPALMTVLRNESRWDRSNVIYESGRLILYDKQADPRMHHIDYGLSAFRRELFDDTPDLLDLATLLHQLSLENRLAGFEVTERFYEIGSPQGLADLENYLETREAVAAGGAGTPE